MKRLLLCGLILLFLLCACSQEEPTGDLCYYLTADAQMGAGASLFATEIRQSSTDDTLKNRVQNYLTGPVDTTLRNPFPEQLQVVDIRQWTSRKTLELTLSEEYDKLSPAALTLANSCLVWTLTGYEEVERVIIRCETGEDVMDGAEALSREQYLTTAGSTEKEFTVLVYFADAQNRYLLPAVRKVVATEDESLGTYVLHQLLAGATEEGMYDVMPQGTRLLGFSVEEGVATVDFSEEFFANRPRTELGERMTLYALVNSLTELDSINRVRILIEGQELEYYTYMILSEPMERWEAVIGPVRTGINEFDATLYYRSWSDEQLAAAPTRIVRDDSKSMGEQIFYALRESDPPNGMRNLIPAGTQLMSLETIEGVCYIDLSAAFAEIQDGVAEERQMVNALVASLCSIDSIDAVVLTIEGGARIMPNYPHDRVLTPLTNWFFPY